MTKTKLEEHRTSSPRTAASDDISRHTSSQITLEKASSSGERKTWALQFSLPFTGDPARQARHAQKKKVGGGPTNKTLEAESSYT